tara:strand:+ start:188 stop:1759 length:1572 start_codon:yes stop_codon:yes gene_type:complete
MLPVNSNPLRNNGLDGTKDWSKVLRSIEEKNISKIEKLNWNFKNTYSELPSRFFQKITPTKVANPKLIKFNQNLAKTLRIDCSNLKSFTDIFSGNLLPRTSKPLAMAYAGHQFGHFVNQLGDGRAILLGELANNSGNLFDVQLKGAGKTMFSRQGDGRSALGPAIREYILSESMYSLGIPSTRALALVTTGEKVFRESALPGAITTRVASSHIRVGTFQYFAFKKDIEALRILADYTIDRHCPEIKNKKQPYLELLKFVCSKHASLVASWMNIGFIHGVMNTDNTTISGETIDFGPCAFLDIYNSSKVFSSIDQFGRYSYSNQPLIAQWNLARFAESLIPIINIDEKICINLVTKIISEFLYDYKNNWMQGIRKKLGLLSNKPDDEKLVEELLETMEKNKLDFTLTFRLLNSYIETNQRKKISDTEIPDSLNSWVQKWMHRINEEKLDSSLRLEIMKKANPVCIPRNHRIEEVIKSATNDLNFEPFEKLLQAMSNPFEKSDITISYSKPPKDCEVVHETFCGT